MPGGIRTHNLLIRSQLLYPVELQTRYRAYDRESHIGKLDKALEEANAMGRTVVSMKDNWNAIFPDVK